MFLMMTMSITVVMVVVVEFPLFSFVFQFEPVCKFNFGSTARVYIFSFNLLNQYARLQDGEVNEGDTGKLWVSI